MPAVFISCASAFRACHPAFADLVWLAWLFKPWSFVHIYNPISGTPSQNEGRMAGRIYSSKHPNPTPHTAQLNETDPYEFSIS